MIYIAPDDFESNCYVLENGDFAFVIDPGINADKILEVLDKNSIKKITVILTHSHVDHWSGAPELIKRTGAQLYMGSSAKDICMRPEVNLAAMAGGMSFPAPDGWLEDASVLEEGGIKLNIIHSPGHTAGGILIETTDGIFTGDTIFASGIGRTDFPTGDYETLLESIKNKIMNYPPSTKLFPGHGGFTTVEDEKNNNPFL